MKWAQHELEQHIDPVELRRTLALWFGVLGGPLAWALQLQLVYLQSQLACLGIVHELGLHITSGIALLITVAALLVAWRHFSRASSRWPVDEASGVDARRQFLGALGIFSGSLFVLVVIALWIAAAMLDVCPAYHS